MNRSSLLAVALLPAFACAALADVPARVEARPEVFVVHVSDNASRLSALSAVSVAVRHTTATVSQALVITDEVENKSNQLTLEVWKRAMAGKAVERLVFVGDVAEETRKQIAVGLGNPAETVLSGSPQAVSEGLAALVNARPQKDCSLPPVQVSTNVTDADVVYAANAAAAAAACGEVLRFEAATGKKALTTEELFSRINAGTKSSTVCIVENGKQALPAALAAAHYRGVVTQLPQALIASAQQFHSTLVGKKLHSITKLEVKPPKDMALHSMALADAKKFYDWLASKGLDREGALENILVFSSKTHIPHSFDRHLIGSPLAPEKRGALVGRMQLSETENLCAIDRSTLQTVLEQTSPAKGKALLSFVAAELNHAAGGSYGPWKDNFGKNHMVNELLGVPQTNDTGIHPELKKAGYKQLYNNGWTPTVPHKFDPLENTPTISWLKQINDGATLFYSSSHGDDDCFFPFEMDKSITSDTTYGDPKWPSRRGRLTTMGQTFTSADWKAKTGELNGVIGVYNACLVANGNVCTNMQRHGAGAVVASYISVSFDGAGWWGVVFVKDLAEGNSVGHALAMAYAHTSEIFAAGLDGQDDTLRYICFGDPHVKMQAPSAK